MIAFQQGDVRLVPANRDKLPKTKEKIIENGIIREGEVTGHKHQIIGPPSATLFITAGIMYLDAPEGAIYQHDDHHKNIVPPLDTPWEVKVVREFDHFEEEAREVTD
jgi:hypothetical protein